MTKRRLIPAYSGFTIVELLVVIVVIGILAAITIVSYAGITNRAIIASIQSDLSNASTLLKMDQITTDSFPTTLALANSGKGITPSQTMDSVIYIPDNTSNPKNFCLQYKKGTNTYAIDNNSTPTKGVCLKNLISNGDFSNGTTGWTTIYGLSTLSASANTLIVTPVSTYWNIAYYENASMPIIAGNKIYVRAKVKTAESGGELVISKQDSPYPITYAASVIADTWYILSGVWDTTGVTGNAGIRINKGGIASIGDVMQIQYAMAIDLTATFGAGNEPTKDQMDTIMSNYPNNWFNIVAKANL